MHNVKIESLSPDVPVPVVVRPEAPGVDLESWAAENKSFLDMILLRQGAILMRGFECDSVERFQSFIAALSRDLVGYRYRSTPRSQVSGKVYTSTEYPPDESIPMHNEMAYTSRWPLRIWFCCLVPAERGGETPIADSRKVFAEIDPAVRERFVAKGVMYVRNYGGGIDLDWQEVFQTTDRGAVESFCRESGIELEWLPNDRLRTRQVCQAAARHPKTGDAVWFNQAHLFHVTSLRPEIREVLQADLAEDELPRNTFYGDGAAIEIEALDGIREVFRKNSVLFPWQQGDVMMLDNMMMAHGRCPFSGPRKVVVGMAEEVHADDLAL